MSKPSKNSRRSCEICGVREVHLSTRRLFSRFPLDEVRCKEWVRVTGNEDLVHVPIEKLHELKHVCGNHFELKYLNKSRSRLLKNAIPTLNFMANPLTENQMSEFPLHMFKSQESTLKPGPIQTAKNLLPEIQETSFSRSSIQTQEKSMKRPLFESQGHRPADDAICLLSTNDHSRQNESSPSSKQRFMKQSKNNKDYLLMFTNGSVS